MSAIITLFPPKSKPGSRQLPLPPLQNGDHLTRAEFERRYAAQPDVKKAELIEGVVYMPSPVHHEKHSKPHSRVIGWLFHYVAATPGTDLGDNATVRLDAENVVQPDALLRIKAENGGQLQLSEDDFLEGAPELVVEIAASSAAYDLHEKLRVYRRNGVQEYLVLLAYEREIHWFQLVEGEYQLLSPGADGVLRSPFFPGLYLLPELFWADDLAGMLQLLQTGLGAPEHAAFVDQLQAKSVLVKD